MARCNCYSFKIINGLELSVFYCKECAEKYDYPYIGLVISFGPCELCGVTKECDNYPTKYLPERNPK